jgi:hypothetical protein
MFGFRAVIRDINCLNGQCLQNMKKSFQLSLGKLYLVRDPATVRGRGFDTCIRIVKVMDEGYFIGNDESIYSKDGEHQGANREFDLVQELP